VTGRHAHPDDYCPRCGSELVVDYQAQLGCGHCGATWQADASLTERPYQPANGQAADEADQRERYWARRRLDEQASDTRGVSMGSR
jgi:DNA-directed RNA polymerase subunit M/transcription elongation factor TFIIS